MSDEKTQETTEEKKPSSLIEQTIQTVERMEKLKQEAKSEADRLEKLKSDAMLSGTAGGRPEIKPDTRTPKEKARDYAQSIMRGKIPNDQK